MNKQEVDKILKENNRTWEEFMEFMKGQTMGLNEDGSTDFYERDVAHFIERKNWNY